MAGMKREEILANPGAAQQALEGVKDAQKDPMPVADLPPADLVNLPGGLVHKGILIKTAVVRELTGTHEEALARALVSKNQVHFLNTLITSGTVRLGDLSPAESARLLPDLLVGDRDELVLAIRTATYGDTVELFDLLCPECGNAIDKLTFSLADDVERTTLDDPAGESMFELKLRGGASARVRLMTGAVLTASYENPDWTTPQRSDVILAKCVETYTDKHGRTHLIPGFPSIVREMPVPDRRKILTEITKRQPGPRYNEIKFNHDGCGEEVTLAPGVTDLFRDLIIGLV